MNVGSRNSTAAYFLGVAAERMGEAAANLQLAGERLPVAYKPDFDRAYLEMRAIEELMVEIISLLGGGIVL